MSSPNLESSISETALHVHAETLAPERKVPAFATAFGCPRDSLNNRFVYLVVSARARVLPLASTSIPTNTAILTVSIARWIVSARPSSAWMWTMASSFRRC